MKLYLVRHGEAASKDVDPERGLTDAGRREVESVASFMKKGSVSVSQILHSGKARARQTAEIFATHIADSHEARLADGLMPNDPVEHYAFEARGYKGDTMLVGHLPFMGRLASRLVAGNEDVAPFNFHPGAALCLECCSKGKWSVVWMVNPQLCIS